MRTTLGFLLILTGILGAQAGASAVTVHGADKLGYNYPNLNSELDGIWDFASKDLAQMDTDKLPNPDIYIENFVLIQESTDNQTFQREWLLPHRQIWLDWAAAHNIPPERITDDWIRSNFLALFPFPPDFRAYQYEDTNRIQISPDQTFLRFVQNDEHGIPHDLVGVGFYNLGHEMTHLALERRGVPKKLHHCIYVTNVDQRPNLMERLVNYLVSKTISSSMVSFYGYQQDVGVDPCSALTAQERVQATAYARELSRPVAAVALQVGQPTK